jgi:hypothetical protein
LFTPNKLTHSQIQSMTSSSTPFSSPFLDEHEYLAFVDPAVGLSYTRLSQNQRFSIRLVERHTRDILTPLFLARDISKLQQFVDHGIYFEQERFDICGLPFDWKACIALIVQRYHDAEIPTYRFRDTDIAANFAGCSGAGRSLGWYGKV